MFQAWINIAFGIWVLFSGFGFVEPWNFFTSGFFIAFFGFLYSRRQWQGVVNGILGTWLIVSSFSPMLIRSWNMWATGAAVLVFAIWRSAAVSGMPPAEEG